MYATFVYISLPYKGAIFAMKVSCLPPGWESIGVKCTQSSGKKRSRGDKRNQCSRESIMTMLNGLEKHKVIMTPPRTLPNRISIHNHGKTSDLKGGANKRRNIQSPTPSSFIIQKNMPSIVSKVERKCIYDSIQNKTFWQYHMWLMIPRSFSLSSHILRAFSSEVRTFLGAICCWAVHIFISYGVKFYNERGTLHAEKYPPLLSVMESSRQQYCDGLIININ